MRPATSHFRVRKMLSARLVRIIENNADEISNRLIETIRRHPDLPVLASKSDTELHEWSSQILENLGYLLSARDDAEIARRYQTKGRARFEEAVPLHEAVLRFHLLKEKTMAFVREQGLPTNSVQLHAEQEFDRWLCRCLDALTYQVVCGYENAMKQAAKIEAAGVWH
jgi:hypothetical protein